MTQSSYRETPEQAARAEAGSQRIAVITLCVMGFLEMDFMFYARFFMPKGGLPYRNALEAGMAQHSLPIIVTFLLFQIGVLIYVWTGSKPKEA